MADFSQYGAPSAEWQDLVAAGVVKPPPTLDPISLRKATNDLREAVAAAQMRELGNKILSQDLRIPTSDGQFIPTRVYRPIACVQNEVLPVYLHFHGGGFLFGTVSTEDAGCSLIATTLSMVVVNACYRHTPEARFPAAHDDAWNAFLWVTSNIREFGGDPDRLAVGGGYAGGNLAASVMLRHNVQTKGAPKILGQVLCIPWLLHPEAFPYGLMASRAVSSPDAMRLAPVLPKTTLDLFTSLLEIKDPLDPLFNVGLAADEDVQGMPKTAFLVAGMDPLRDEGLLYAEKLARNSVQTSVHVFPGVPHGFARFTTLQAAKRWTEVILESLTWILDEERVASTRQNVEIRVET